MSALCIKALELNQLITEKLFYSHFVLNFNSKTGRFEAEDNQFRLKYFYISWLLITAILWPIATFYVIFYKGIFHPTTVSSDRLFFTMVVSAPGMLCIGINYSLLGSNRHQIKDYLNLLLDLKAKFLGNNHPKEKHEDEASLAELVLVELRKLRKKSTRKQMDLVGLVMVSTVLYLGVVPLLYIPGPLITRKDPFSYPVQDIFEYDHYPLWLYLPFRLVPAIGAVICTMEAVRSLRTIFIILIVCARITASMLQSINELSKTDLSLAMERFAMMYAVHVKSMQPAGALMFVCIEGGMFIAIISLTGTFVGWKILSPFLYWLNPLMAVMAILIIAIAMPCASCSAELSLWMIRNWKFRVDECQRGSRHLNRRILKSFQVMAFYINGLGVLVGETKTRMFETIAMNTVDTVLMASDYIN